MRTNTQPYSNIRGHYPSYPSASCGTGNRTQLFAYAYYRLSREEAQRERVHQYLQPEKDRRNLMSATRHHDPEILRG